MVQRKGWLLSLVLVILLVLSACGPAATKGNTEGVERVIPGDAAYTEADIAAAMDIVEKKFERDFKGCTLLKLWYDADKGKEEKHWAKEYRADEAIVLLSDFHVDSSGADESLQYSDYSDWNWILIRNTGGSWMLRTWGY